jgi:hypothetical protein
MHNGIGEGGDSIGFSSRRRTTKQLRDLFFESIGLFALLQLLGRGRKKALHANAFW